MSLTIVAGESREEFLQRAGEYFDAQLAAAVEVVQQAVELTASEQAPVATLGELRWEQTTTEKPRIDRESGVIHRVHVLGNVSKHGYSYATEAQEEAKTRFEGMPVGIDHNYQRTPMKVEETFGKLVKIEVDGKGTWADLHYLKTHSLAEQILEDAERGTGIFALSPVADVLLERDAVVKKFVPRRVDVVVGGATTKSLFEQAPPGADVSADALRRELADVKAELADVKARQVKYEQFVSPRATVEAAVQKATEGIDLQKFWRD